MLNNILINNYIKKFSTFLFITIICTQGFLVLVTPKYISADAISDLQAQINAQKDKIQQLEDQKKIYQDKINATQKQAISLKNQISILDNQLAEIRTEIKQKQEQIKETELSISSLQLTITNQSSEIDKRRQQLVVLLQLINQNDNKNYLEVFLLNNNISEFLTQSQYLENLQASLQDNVEKMKLIKSGLETQQSDLKNQKQTLANLQQNLISQKQSLSLKQGAKNNLLSETQDAEWKFQTLLAGAIQEQKAAEAAINSAEKIMRHRLAEKDQQQLLAKLNENGGPLILSWPVPKNTITTGFHDQDYPFIRSLGQHPAIDIRVAYGTTIKAPAAGYVGKIHKGGMGYSYIMLIHRDGISTVYGHVSTISVIEGQYVNRGDMIGRSGGIPGTPGAGSFCTGPHLHFEVRLNGIPVNPISYLI